MKLYTVIITAFETQVEGEKRIKNYSTTAVLTPTSTTHKNIEDEIIETIKQFALSLPCKNASISAHVTELTVEEHASYIFTPAHIVYKTELAHLLANKDNAKEVIERIIKT